MIILLKWKNLFNYSLRVVIMKILATLVSILFLKSTFCQCYKGHAERYMNDPVNTSKVETSISLIQLDSANYILRIGERKIDNDVEIFRDYSGKLDDGKIVFSSNFVIVRLARNHAVLIARTSNRKARYRLTLGNC